MSRAAVPVSSFFMWWLWAAPADHKLPVDHPPPEVVGQEDVSLGTVLGEALPRGAKQELVSAVR